MKKGKKAKINGKVDKETTVEPTPAPAPKPVMAAKKPPQVQVTKTPTPPHPPINLYDPS